ncbi:DNA-methyltransferase [Dyadobacter frigoris]|uniref:Methyltransferase n=1 Tax=Dyadobacter frigoris TaxID=2576211 RepID=A0A4U6DC48_9BACT|nr:site-specific DNA-methyltransferase [Dyadobacter frigoris]TKT94061.1 site-specific DNA-methyltransferase [Dyadobacter frigoris]
MSKKKELYKIHEIDARNLDLVIKKQVVDVTITSPPYFDMKDYGYAEQIGYGQSYTEYLNDLHVVFSKVFLCTKETGTLWVIIDAFRKNGEMIPLPFDFANKIKDIGWKLQEIIIWGKDRTVPWAHKGQMRNSFEYVLMFSKTEHYTFYIDKVRNYDALKKWWVRYPERYNPRGKTPEAIWNFDIPVQGSWGEGYIKHFCPLPEEMIAQILKLTTVEGDVVLDPFSGTGAVLSKADNMKRKFVGTELNPEYIEMFKNYLLKTGDEKRNEYEIEKRNLIDQNSFEKLILDLRALKFARVLNQKVLDEKIDSIALIWVEETNIKPEKPNSIIVVQYSILIKHSSQYQELETLLQKIVSQAPLSKFGIEHRFEITSNYDDFIKKFIGKEVFIYTNKITHKFKKSLLFKDISNLTKGDLIISSISVDLNEKDYE